MNMTIAEESGRIKSLDGWRAIAIALVVFSHFPYATNFPDAWRRTWKIAFDGDLGVRIFFVLSGFLITGLLLKEYDRFGKIDLKLFYCRRVLRIFPLYFSYLAVLAALELLGLQAQDWSSWLGSLTFTRNVVGRGTGATVHFWSLAVEEQFYLLWPCLIVGAALFRRSSRALIVIGALILTALAARWWAAIHGPGMDVDRLFGDRSFFRYADSLAVGCLVAVLPFPARFKTMSWWVPALCLALLVGSRSVQVSAAIPEPAAAVVIPLVQALMLAVLLMYSIAKPSGILIAFLNSSAMVTLGVLSYSLYVWHVLFLAYFAGEHFQNLALYDWKWWLIPSLLAAYLSHRYIERPFLRMKQLFHPR